MCSLIRCQCRVFYDNEHPITNAFHSIRCTGKSQRMQPLNGTNSRITEHIKVFSTKKIAALARDSMLSSSIIILHLFAYTRQNHKIKNLCTAIVRSFVKNTNKSIEPISIK